jgi:hypothetical protein
MRFNSEAFAMDDRGAILVVLLLVDPHCLEGGQRGKDGTTEPHGVFTLGWGKDLDFIGGGCQLVELLPHALAHAFEQG